MMQAVVHSDQRAGLGMHYTSVENIMKVLRPLFLDELDEEYTTSEDDARKLRKLHDRISAIKVFDPACGSGNFLVIAYKELRKLEHRILERLRELEADPKGSGLFEVSRISLANFYGIEIDDFAHEIAKLSLWLAKHQTNKRFEELFGSRLQMIPLTEAGHITCANAARADWRDVTSVSPSDEIYLCGNPPYQGGTKQTPEQTEDLLIGLEDPKANKYLDYVSIWIYKAARYTSSTDCRAGLVVTNSVCQGNQVAHLWPKVLSQGVDIGFAHTSFRWTNQARGKAGVTCIVIGLQRKGSSRNKYLYDGGNRRQVDSINPYLVGNGANVIVASASSPLTSRPEMVFGSMPRDGGWLLMSADDAAGMIARDRRTERFLKRFIGAEELLQGNPRYCIWVADSETDEAWSIPDLADRFERVRVERARSDAASTRQFAEEPHRFVQRAYKNSPAIIVPSVTSERREYIPIGFLEAGTVVSNRAYVIYDARPWIFGVLSSRMHMAWVCVVSGRFETRFSYSNTVVYNTFPVPELSDDDKTRLAEAAFGVLGARQQFPDRTLAELYDPDKMPATLLNAHHELDEVVDRLYSPTGFASDDERLAKLFEMYEELTSKQEKLNA